MRTQQNILITGATGGIGQAITRGLANEHTNLILVAKNLESLQKLAENIDGNSCSLFTLDLENYLEREKFCDVIASRFKKIDWVIHSAGFVTKEDTMINSEEGVAKKTFEINFFAPFHLTKKLASRIGSNGGSIFISSTSGVYGNGFTPAYAASKGALNSFARSLALSWQETKRRSITICPGPTNTNMRERLAGDSAQHQSPKIIADLIGEILRDEKTYPNNSNLIVKNGNVVTL